MCGYSKTLTALWCVKRDIAQGAWTDSNRVELYIVYKHKFFNFFHKPECFYISRPKFVAESQPVVQFNINDINLI